uniref:Putative ribonuclease H-like domain-containing protein n=1 Tax=Tanacetum cinerariifolium TaxID=118510 RepID=A0A699GLW0_TANCI|nr:putative ribonuclease H-like domain-containing protein [Tanacetum cinerariifolium]
MLLKQSDLKVLETKVNIKPINYAELNRLSEDIGKCFVPQQELSDEQAFRLETSHPSTDQSASSPVKIKAPRELHKEKLYLLHMDLCGPMRVASINRKKYILMIVNDYSRFTWVKFLATKDEVTDFIIKFLKMIQVRLNTLVRNIRTYNGTKFVNQTLPIYYETIGISHKTSVGQSSQQNGVVERRNRTLVEATRTMTRTSMYDSCTSSSGLVPNHIPQQPCIPSIRDDWDDLFQPIFDECLNPPTIPVSLVLVVAAPRIIDLADSPVSTSINQDAPSTSISSSQE